MPWRGNSVLGKPPALPGDSSRFDLCDGRHKIYFPPPGRGRAKVGVPRQRCARTVTSHPHPHSCPGCAKSSRTRSAGGKGNPTPSASFLPPPPPRGGKKKQPPPPPPPPGRGRAKRPPPRSAGKRSTGPFPVSASPPFKGEGEKIRRLQAAHGVIGAFEALGALSGALKFV